MKVFVDRTLYDIEDPYFEEATLNPANAGLDLKVVEVIEGTLKSGRKLTPHDGQYSLYKNKIYTINTAVKLEIPAGFVGLLGLRSSAMQAGFKMPSVGVIDHEYRGFLYCTTTYCDVNVFPGGGEGTPYAPYRMFEESSSVTVERYARLHQIFVVPYYKSIELVNSSDELSTTDRGEAGFGTHTGTTVKL